MSRERLKTALAQVGVDGGRTVLVHSAFRQMGLDGYHPEAVVDDFAEFFHVGTLLMPTMSWRFVRPDTPFFDESSTPSNTGLLTEIFRNEYSEGRSIHPTHSVSGRGKWADDLLKEHNKSTTPCDKNSPFSKLIDADGLVIMLGVAMDCCTLIHHVEEIIAPDVYCVPVEQIETYECRDRNGVTHFVKLRRHKLLPRTYYSLQDRLAYEGKMKFRKLGNTIMRIFSASDIASLGNSLLRDNSNAFIATGCQRYRMM